jgi:hypothetical protein
MRLLKLLGCSLALAIVIADVANWVYSGVMHYQERQMAQQREAEFRAIFDRMWQRMNDGAPKSEINRTVQY